MHIFRSGKIAVFIQVGDHWPFGGPQNPYGSHYFTAHYYVDLSSDVVNLLH